MSIRSPVVLLLALLALSGRPDRAGAEARDPSSLKGLGRTLCILVDEPDTDAQRAGLTAEKLKAAVEENLRKAGFTVAPSGPCLRASLRTHALAAAGLVSHFVELALVEEVSPTRDPGLRFKAPTWLHGTVGTSLSGRLEPAVLATAASSVAVFADEYQLVNSDP
ncbi:MAG: hypothetical protein HZB55_21460 [Deltaproteobacteria bacterium]|nr:hypothetical protein [Deltaproteobacteria bacterium]